MTIAPTEPVDSVEPPQAVESAESEESDAPTTAGGSGDEPTDPPGRRTGRHWAARFVAAIPDRLAIIALCVTVAVAICVQLEIFRPYTVLPLAVVFIIASWRMAPRPVAADRWQVIGVLIALLITLAWFYLNRPMYSELIAVRRDPSIYTLRGFHLMNHPSPDVTLTQQALDISKQIRGVLVDFGSPTNSLTRYFQSTTVVPGLIAVAGWAGGASLLFQANLIIGVAAMIATYAVARRLAGPLFGLVPVVGMALCMPMAAFSRVAYTEPISMLVVMVGLLGLFAAWREQRPAVWILAGLGIGAASLCRVDGALALAGAAVGLGAIAGFAASTATRRKALFGLLWFLLGAAPMFALGYTDLKFHSPEYLRAIEDEAHLGWLGAAGVVALALLLGVLPLTPVGRWLAGRSRPLALVSVAVTAIVLIVMCLRPLFYVSRGLTGIYATAVGNRQRAEGLPIDPTRAYDEMSVNWLTWYFGWPLVIIAGLGVLGIVWYIVRQRNAQLLLVFAVPAVNAILYLNMIQITPDQIWAMRRFLPVIIPGMLLAVGWAAAVFTGWAMRRMPERRWVPAVAVPVGLAATMMFPLASWGPMFPIREGAGQYNMVMTSCARIGPDNKVLILGSLPAMGYYQPTYRNLCGSEVLAYAPRDEKGRVIPVTSDTVKKIADSWGGEITVVTFHPEQVSWTQTPTAPVTSSDYQMWESTLSRRPSKAVDERTEIYMGTVQPDGTVAPMSP